MAFLLRRSSVFSSLSSRFVARRAVSSQLNGIKIEHASLGNSKNPTVLMIMGHSGTMTQWMPIDQQLADAGFHVIKFDNRDMGRTQRFDDVVPDPEKYLADGSKTAYCVDDMADDACAVLDHYGVDKAHVVGASMGGLIAQVVAVRHAARCKTLTPIMTAPALNAAIGQSIAKDGGEFLGKLMQQVAGPVGKDVTLEQFLEKKIGLWALLVPDPSFPVFNEGSKATIREHMTIDYNRNGFDYDGSGGNRQSLAVNSWENSKSTAHMEGLKNIVCPTLVLHGIHDPLIPVESGRELAAAIPGARMIEYLGGHSCGNHPAVRNHIVAAIIEHITASEHAP